MPQESQLAHRVLSNTALPYISNVSPSNTDPHFVSGSSDILTSVNGYAERRPGFATAVEGTPTVFNNLQRLFTWDRFDGSFYIMACDINASGFAQVYETLAGGNFTSIYTDTTANVFDFVVSNNTVYFSNGIVAKKWDPLNGLSNWGIAIGSINNVAGPTITGAGTNNGSGGTAWTNPNNVTSNVAFASVTLNKAAFPATAASQGLDAETFGFTIPAGNTILGIQVDFVASQVINTGGGANHTFFGAQLLKAGVPVGFLKASSPAGAPGALTLGGTSDLWGSSWVSNDINQTTFGVEFSAGIHGVSAENTTWQVDNVKITIYSLGGPAVSVAAGAGTMTATAGYVYVFCFGNSATGHISSPTLPSASTGVFTLKANVSVTLTASTDPQVNQIRLFRTTDGGGGTYFELPNSPFPNSSGAVLDNAPDSALQVGSIAPTPTFNDPPTPSFAPNYFSGRIWMFNNNKVYFSGLEEINQGVPEESFPSGQGGNFWSFDEPVQGLGLAGGVNNQVIGEFCGGRVYAISGNTLDTFRRILVSQRRGARNRMCVSNMGGMCAWLDSANQVWATDGNTLQELSIPIRPDLVGINQANCSMTFHTSGRFHWLVLSTGTKLFVYDIDQEQWMPPWNFSCNYIFSGETSPGNYVLMAAKPGVALQLNPNAFFDVGAFAVVQLAADTFVRANENPIHAPWVSLGGPFVAGQIKSNQYAGQDGLDAEVLYDGGVPWTVNQYSQATLRTLNFGTGFAVLSILDHLASGSTEGDNYAFIINDDLSGGIGSPTRLTLESTVAGVGTLLAGPVIVTPLSGDVFNISKSGNTITCFRNGAAVPGLNAIDNSITTGKPGIGSGPVSGVAADVTWDTWSGGSLGAPYAPVIKTNLLSVVPDFGSRFSYIASGIYNEPTRTGVPWTFQITNNGQALGDVAICQDEDPTQATYQSIASALQDTAVTYNRKNGVFLKQLVYPQTAPASRWIGMKIVLALANQADNIYEIVMGYKPLGGR